MMDGFISSSCLYFFLNYLWCFARFVQFVWRPCRESGIHVKWKDWRKKNMKNRVWMLRGPCWCCWRGLREFGFLFLFFFKSTAKQETREGEELVSFFDPTSLWMKYDSASSEWFKEEISDQLNFSLWLYGTTFHSSYQTSSFRPDSQQTMLEMVMKDQNQHTHTHRHTHFVTAVGFSSRIHGRSQWQQVLKQG